MRPIGTRPTLAELEVRRQAGSIGIDQAAKATTGMSHQRLLGHLKLAERIMLGEPSILRSQKVRSWLHSQARESGRSPQEVDAVIQKVLRASTPEEGVRIYATGLTNDPNAGETGLGLAKHFVRESTALEVGGRLKKQDLQRLRSGETFQLPDDGDRFRKEREAATTTGTRAALERAMASSGLHSKPQTIEDHRARASWYAEQAAQRLEATQAARDRGERVDLRRDIEDAFTASKALQVKNDVGLSADTSLSDVRERTDQQMAAAQAMADDIEST